jgi:hypothetical protein
MTMLFFFTITFWLISAASAVASSPNEAARTLSRFPQGSVPTTAPVIDAIAILGEQGDREHISLLNSLLKGENETIRQATATAIEHISDRRRFGLRSKHRGPSKAQIQDWLASRTLLGPDGRVLGKNEQFVAAYTTLALEESLAPFTPQWRALGDKLEVDGEPTAALQVYASAALEGDWDALQEVVAFDVDAESLMLGLFTTLPADHRRHHALAGWLIEHGTAHTVAVFSDIAVRGTALERAVALDALSTMIQDGRLSAASAYKARRRIERSQSDPHGDVRLLARTALGELQY